MKRREFIAALGGAAAWPVAARAQQRDRPLIGFLNSGAPDTSAQQTAAFRRGLGQSGFTEKANVDLDFHWAHGDYNRLPEMANALVRQRVDVLLAGGPPAARAAKAATAAIPIVFTSGDDPVKTGLVDSISRPSGNVTGVHVFLTGLESKRLGLMREIIPRADVIAALVNPHFPDTELQLRDVATAAQSLGQRIEIVYAGNDKEFEPAFQKIVQTKARALLVGTDPFFNSRRNRIIALAASHAVPAIYEQRSFPDSGGLMSYGTSLSDGYLQAGIYVGRILKGSKPSELPVVQSTRFEFVINLKTAKALGLDIPPTVLALADEVIE